MNRRFKRDYKAWRRARRVARHLKRTAARRQYAIPHVYIFPRDYWRY